MRVMLLTGDRKTERIYVNAAEQAGTLRLCAFKNAAQVLERQLRDPFEALLSDDPSILRRISERPFRWPAHIFLLTNKPFDAIAAPECLTFCFSKDIDPKDVLLRIGQFPAHRKPAIDPDVLISGFLQRTGVPVSLNGFSYLWIVLRVLLPIQNPLDAGTINDLYAILSLLTGISASVAEHAIRHAIESAWIRADPFTLEKLFGYTVRPDRGAPSNAAFLFRALDHIKLMRERGRNDDTGRNA